MNYLLLSNLYRHFLYYILTKTLEKQYSKVLNTGGAEGGGGWIRTI